MKKRMISWAVLSLAVAVVLTGCGNNPDDMFKKANYAGAYTEFVKRGGLSETTMKTEVANGSFDSRNKAGNQAIHDYYYAAESQKKLGNETEAKGFYQRAVDVSQYQIRIPQDKSIILKDSYDSLIRAVENFRSREVDLYNASQNTGSQNTDPYGNSGGSNTDPYGSSGGSSSGGSSNTDPYGSSSGRSSGGSKTDPYGSSGGSSSGGSKTDPYAYSIDTGDYLYRSYYDSIQTRRRDFERLLYSTTSAEVPDIAKLKTQYESMSRSLDTYLMFTAPGGLLSSPNSLSSEITYRSFQSASGSFRRSLYGAPGNITYIANPIKQSEPQLVIAAQAALGNSTGTAPAPAPVKDEASGIVQDKTDSF